MNALRPLLLVCALPLGGCFVDIPLGDRPCESDADCLDDSACVLQTCVERIACADDGDCPDDRACGDGACRAPREVETDAGPDPVEDAGEAGEDAGPGEDDAGPGEDDAGPDGTDAGPDETDAGPQDPDSGTPLDAGDEDAGGVDAGPDDAGNDAGPADAGYDAGPADAGVICHGDPVEVCAPVAQVRKVCQTAGPECDPSVDFQSPFTALSDLQSGGALNGYVFVYGGRYYFEVDFNGTDDVTIVGEDGAALRGSSGTVIDVQGSARVTLRGVEVSDDDDGDGDRDNSSSPIYVDDLAVLIVEDSRIGPSQRIGLNADGSARVELRRSVVKNNSNGGVDIGESVVAILENSLFDNNGDSGGNGSNLGNVRLTTVMPVLFRHNTVVSGNRKRNDETGGVLCSFEQHLYSSIIRNNDGFEISSATDCVLHTSNVQGHAGGTTIDEDPLFGGNYHLQAGSPCIDTGTENTSPDFPGEPAPTRDFDYDARPAGAASDMGFDEVP